MGVGRAWGGLLRVLGGATAKSRSSIYDTLPETQEVEKDSAANTADSTQTRLGYTYGLYELSTARR